ncbi:MAG: beta-propeller fold lactonase family protein, partial [Lachnospiraceae bacterium]|nr:beta-propeller fold lactonase family protein [Lachnospiraceae bacterium]
MKSDQEGSVKDGRYIAYISSYTFGSKEDYGIRVYDVDVAKGRMTEKDKVEITNSSYLTESHNRKFLYSITDMGVEGYRIRDDGTLDKINEASINGMRSCYLSTDYEDKFLFCAGYHDGKVTVLRLNEDGSIGAITDEIYHKGLGLGTGRSNMPHVECVRMTRDNKYVCAVDSGMNRTIVYQLDHRNGTLKNVDIIHADQEAAPRHIRFSPNGKFAYIVCEQKSL